MNQYMTICTLKYDTFSLFCFLLETYKYSIYKYQPEISPLYLLFFYFFLVLFCFLESTFIFFFYTLNRTTLNETFPAHFLPSFPSLRWNSPSPWFCLKGIGRTSVMQSQLYSYFSYLSSLCSSPLAVHRPDWHWSPFLTSPNNPLSDRNN